MSGQAGTKRTVVEEGTEVQGTMASSCPIVVMGKIQGEISGPSMEIAESGKVAGRIKVTELRSRGELAGELEAESVELAGCVLDDTVIRARSLEVSAATGPSVLFGECELSIGDEPDKQRAIDEATGAARPALGPPIPVMVPPAAEAAPRKRRTTGATPVVDDVPDARRL